MIRDILIPTAVVEERLWLCVCGRKKEDQATTTQEGGAPRPPQRRTGEIGKRIAFVRKSHFHIPRKDRAQPHNTKETGRERESSSIFSLQQFGPFFADRFGRLELFLLLSLPIFDLLPSSLSPPPRFFPSPIGAPLRKRPIAFRTRGTRHRRLRRGGVSSHGRRSILTAESGF